MATPQGNDTVYVAGLPDVVTEKDIAAHFGSIGTLKQDKKRRCDKIWLYRDRDTGLPKGDATVSYADPHAAEAAVSWFNNTEFMGSTLAVSLAERKGGGDSLNLPASHYADPLGRDADSGNAHPTPNPPVTAASSDVPVGGGGNTPAGVGGAQPKPKTTRDGDWPCPNPACGNTNFAFRGKCNRCGTSRPGGDDSAAGNKPPASNPKPKELRNGDWACPDASCGNVNFAYRGQCNRCGSQRPAGAKGMQGVGGRDGGKPSIFGPDDWTCSNCFNVNWARRNKCNECGTGKEGKAVEKREGRGGGHKEIDDEDEREETARRRRENEEREIYDDFGNLKKQFRASAGRGGADRDYDRGGRDRDGAESGTIRTGGTTGTGTGTDVGTDPGAATGATGGIGGTADDGADPGRGRLDARRRQGGTRTTRSRRIGGANQSRAHPPTSKPTGGVTPSSPPGTNRNNRVDRTGRGGVRVLAACTIDIKTRPWCVTFWTYLSSI